MKNPRGKKKRVKLSEVLKGNTDGKSMPLEKTGATNLIKYMRSKGWLCIKIPGNILLKGLPDYYCIHPTHGKRWIETKSWRKSHCLEASQRTMFRKMTDHGDEIWVLRDSRDYKKLFRAPNWHQYLSINR